MEKKKSCFIWILCYTLLFGLLCLLIYRPVFSSGYSLVKASDGIDQHLKALIFYGRWLRSVLKSLIPGSGVSFPGFSFVLGFGSDAATTLHYYAVGDPLNLLAVFCSDEQCIWLYQILIFLRMWLAGLALALFVSYKGRFRGAALLGGALVYAFSAFALASSFRHPFFINPMIYFPLILLGTEKLFREKKRAVLILSVCTACLSSFYYFYMIAVLTALYVLWLLIFRYGLKDKKRLLRLIGAEALCSFTGVLLAGFFFLPVIRLFLNNPRSGISHELTLFYPVQYYIRLLQGSFLSVRITSWSFLGVTLFALFGAGVMILKKGGSRFGAAAGGVLLMLMIPAAGWAMNGFSYVSNRWCWGAALVFACLLVLSWEEILGLGQRVIRIGFALSGAVLLSVLVFMAASRFFEGSTALKMISYSRDALLEALSLAAVLWILLLLRRRGVDREKIRRIGSGLMVLAIMICIANNGSRLRQGVMPTGLKSMDLLVMKPSEKEVEKASKKELKKIRKSFWTTEGRALMPLLTGEEDFFRYTGKVFYRNNSIPVPLPSTQYYWSLIDSRISDFLKEMGLNTCSSYAFKDLDSRSVLCRFLSARYFVDESDSFVPAGYHLLSEEGDPFYRAYRVYECDKVLPFAAAFDSCLTREAYGQLPEIEREQVLLQSVVMDEVPEGFSEGRPVFTETALPIRLDADEEEICMKPGELEVKKENAVLKIAVETEPGMENSLYISGLTFTGEEAKSEEGLAGFQDNTDGDESTASSYLTITGWQGDKKILSDSMKLYATYHIWNSGRDSFLYCLGTQRMDCVEVTFKKPGTYSVRDLIVYSRDPGGDDALVEAASDLSQEFDFHLDQNYSTSLITGHLGSEKDRLVLLSLPFHDNWRLFVDGEETPLWQADTMLCAFALKAGEHEIRLTYQTQGALAGRLLSLAGLCSCLLLWLQKRKKSVSS